MCCTAQRWEARKSSEPDAGSRLAVAPHLATSLASSCQPDAVRLPSWPEHNRLKPSHPPAGTLGIIRPFGPARQAMLRPYLPWGLSASSLSHPFACPGLRRTCGRRRDRSVRWGLLWWILPGYRAQRKDIDESFAFCGWTRTCPRQQKPRPVLASAQLLAFPSSCPSVSEPGHRHGGASVCGQSVAARVSRLDLRRVFRTAR